ncbi:MAG: molybdopterin-dependent oxidoreductase [Sphingobium sp.]|jgi:assimilatory nitrate reductase catalytic subunit|uniref:molybdopterin-dependent oxidoreductase n=1 Tax=Sphingobium sp. TaxID=1912891 RepID=UPI000C50E97A|nr:molybdopterin-dependent oxidoreductase [Sphingobium sp.]MBU0659435.1 molybdopterin-dependent oxidoreductase [Alphaproteobacteria bacterium]MBA4754073.1 molybdopterin-dependent oxidoreductase [Sphingobium sp.]MBS89119.1 NagC family transcriptional regulator [Sphingobium sp.]MBU0776252.1 molybdopterin-dependent oxidoreductase [Alphaproteobacteria bacterium]MBU0866550.1 molybdopterin-dependent oxidoreductase [Alphaproteobacteria bacterium]
MAIVRSQCGQCGVGCGIRAVTDTDRRVTVEGDRLHPANGGLLCDRGQALGDDAISLEGRLLRPLVDGRQTGWDRAIAQVARRLSTIMARHGPGSIALHIGGGLLTEDYYVANKLMKGFFGSAHIHAPWRDGSSAAHVRAFGEDVMPAAYEDIDRAATILLVGGGIMAQPVLLDRVKTAREAGARLVLLTDAGVAIDADLRLTLKPGSAARLLTGALLHGHDKGRHDTAFLARSVAVPADFWERFRPGHDIWSIARATGLTTAAIRAFYDEWIATDRVVTLFTGSECADLAAAVINLHLASGRIGRPGATPFAITGAANGMGAREVGCVADSLAAHRDFAPDARASVARFWGARLLAEGPGLEGEALLRAMRDGQVRALWSIGADRAAEAWLGEARALVPLAVRSTDSVAEQGDGWSMLLPSATWVEKDGTLTGMDRLVSRQRRLLPLPGEARPDWWMLTKVAQAMGWGDAFHYERPADIYREHGRLTAYGNDGGRLLNLRRHAPISNPAYDELTPWRWGEVPFDGGHFPTPDGRARFA